ncbi:transposase [Pseudogemmobacter sp. W21_MBD1_M6]|uniref:transposase n=1 Tax=Pseudogemmobacter sp. W21_MBD1_M6 TaxID=3240271 RepID=UPI003F97EEE5
MAPCLKERWSRNFGPVVCYDLRHVLNDVVSDVSYAGSAMRGEILGLERRRFWRDEDKLEIVTSVGVGGATVTQVAQRHEIMRQQIYALRHELKKKGLWSPEAAIPGFLTGCIRRNHAAIFNFMAGVMPPMPMLGRSLL